MSAGWEITDHCCRRCFGRILRRGETVCCADCGAEAEGEPQELCACGTRFANGKPMGLRCVANPNVSADLPMQIVAIPGAAA